jgi:predicted DNA-binding protein
MERVAEVVDSEKELYELSETERLAVPATTRTLTVTLADETWDMLEEVAEYTSRPLSSFITDAIERGIEDSYDYHHMNETLRRHEDEDGKWIPADEMDAGSANNSEKVTVAV